MLILVPFMLVRKNLGFTRVVVTNIFIYSLSVEIVKSKDELKEREKFFASVKHSIHKRLSCA